MGWGRRPQALKNKAAAASTAKAVRRESNYSIVMRELRAVNSEPRELLFLGLTAQFLGGLLLRNRFAFQALGALFALGGLHGLTAQELDIGHLGVVAVAEAGLDDAGVASGAIAEAEGDAVKQLGHRLGVEQIAGRLEAGVQRAALAQGHHALGQRTDGLGLGHGGL